MSNTLQERASRPVRRSLAAAAVAAVALTGAAACGSASGKTTSAPSSSHATPKAELQASLAALYKRSGLTITAKVDTTAARFTHIDETGTDPDSPAEAQVAGKLIAGGSIVITEDVPGGTLDAALASGKAAQVEIAVNAGGAPGAIDLRVVNKTVYARAEVAQLAALTGETSGLTALTAHVPASAAFLRQAIAGKWLALPESTLTSLEGLAGGASASATPSAAASAAGALRTALTQILSNDVTVTKAGTSPTLGDHLVLTGNSRTVATDLVSAVKGSLGSLPGGGALSQDLNPTSVESKQVTVNAYVKNGVLTTIQLDLAQFSSGADLTALDGQPLYIEEDLTAGSPVTAPTGAITLSLTQLAQAFESIEGSSSA